MNKLTLILATGLAALAFTGTSLGATAEPVTPARITAARTAADHEAIARAYDEAAAAAEAEARLHVSMADTYRHGMGKSPSQSMGLHCDRLVKSARAAAVEYRALAAEHRKLAATVK